MQILKVIKSSTPQSPEVLAMLNLMYSENWIQTKLAEYFKPYGITRQQFNVLRILRGQYPTPVNVKLVRERLLVKLSDTSRLIDRMVKSEMVVRTSSKKDGRAVDLLISEKGLALLKTLDEAESNMLKIMQTLTTEELEQLTNLLEKLRND